MKYTLSQLVDGVEPVPGESLVYLVKSHSRPDVIHRVDLGCYCGAGRCGCEHFATKINPKLRDGTKPAPYLECRHIRKARRYLAIEVAQRIIEQKLKATNENMTKNHHKTYQRDESAPAY